MKNILITKIFTVAFTFTVSTVSNFSLLAQFGGGQGTQTNPYQIYTKQHLDELADSVANSPSNNTTTGYNWSRDKHFKVMNDITNPVTRMIGTFQPRFSFQGNFDGQNNTITVNINETINYFVGLFGCVYSGSIKNVVVTGSINAMSTVSEVGIVGIIVTGTPASDDVKISNCINSADIVSNYCCGGIVGSITTIFTMNNKVVEVIIENCTNIGTVKGKATAGGILSNIITGILGVCIINNCINDGLIDGNYVVGGIAGYINDKATISGCFNGGVVSGNGVVGCIVGIKEAGATVINNHYDMQMCNEE